MFPAYMIKEVFMDTDIFRIATTIDRGAILKRNAAKGSTLFCASGQVWVTQRGDRRDILLSSGQDFTFDHTGEAYVQAIGPSAAAVVLCTNGADATVRDPVAAARLRLAGVIGSLTSAARFSAGSRLAAMVNTPANDR